MFVIAAPGLLTIAGSCAPPNGPVRYRQEDVPGLTGDKSNDTLRLSGRPQGVSGACRGSRLGAKK